MVKEWNEQIATVIFLSCVMACICPMLLSWRRSRSTWFCSKLWTDLHSICVPSFEDNIILFSQLFQLLLCLRNHIVGFNNVIRLFCSFTSIGFMNARIFIVTVKDMRNWKNTRYGSSRLLFGGFLSQFQDVSELYCWCCCSSKITSNVLTTDGSNWTKVSCASWCSTQRVWQGSLILVPWDSGWSRLITFFKHLSRLGE